MHRSGTSALMGCLEEWGVFLGAVVRKAPFNVKGNNESLAIRTLHDQVLADAGGSWDEPPASAEWLPERKAALREIIRSFDRPCWGFKDPRTLLVLSGWLEALPDLRLVGTFRHPSSVVASLVSRQPKLSKEQALEIWLHYNRQLLLYARRQRVPLVCFDRPADEYVQGAARAATRLGLEPRVQGTFFEARLRHFDSPDWTGLPDPARSLYEALLKLAV